MVRRLAREEAGAALGLAVIMVVLVGVMGAGLLVFVRNDLNAVVEVNSGQTALEAAEAGVKSARSQLLGVSSPTRYDGGTNDSPWSAYGIGRSFTFDGDPVQVTIRHLPAVAAGSTPTRDQAPETLPAGQPELPGGREYFRVIAEGRSGDSVRVVEAILNTYAQDVPRGYFTPGDININGSSACISGVSLFALGDIDLPAKGKCADGEAITGEDSAYGNWQNDINPTPRLSTKAGVGATGTVSNKVAGRDYDSTTTPSFRASIDSAAAPGTQMRFPFTPDPQIVDLREFERMAREQDASTAGNTNYFEVTSSGESVTTWPDESTKETVVYYKFTDGTPANNSLKWFVSGNCTVSPSNPPKEGTLVVEGAGFTTQPNKARFKGVVIVREGNYVPGTADDGTSTDSGNTCLNGFVNATGEITISGSVTPASTADLSDRPGFTGVRQWSWRECYSINCS